MRGPPLMRARCTCSRPASTLGRTPPLLPPGSEFLLHSLGCFRMRARSVSARPRRRSGCRRSPVSSSETSTEAPASAYVGLVVPGVVLLDYLAILDPAAPSAGLEPGHLDQRLETAQARPAARFTRDACREPPSRSSCPAPHPMTEGLVSNSVRPAAHDSHAGRIQNAMTAHCSAAAAITRPWKISWYPNTDGTGSGRLMA